MPCDLLTDDTHLKIRGMSSGCILLKTGIWNISLIVFQLRNEKIRTISNISFWAHSHSHSTLILNETTPDYPEFWFEKPYGKFSHCIGSAYSQTLINAKKSSSQKERCYTLKQCMLNKCPDFTKLILAGTIVTWTLSPSQCATIQPGNHKKTAVFYIQVSLYFISIPRKSTRWQLKLFFKLFIFEVFSNGTACTKRPRGDATVRTARAHLTPPEALWGKEAAAYAMRHWRHRLEFLQPKYVPFLCVSSFLTWTQPRKSLESQCFTLS